MMATAFWLVVGAYLLVGFAQLVAAGFRTEEEGLTAQFRICSVALAFALTWPLRLLSRPEE
jgi:hypothetical protein